MVFRFLKQRREANAIEQERRRRMVEEGRNARLAREQEAHKQRDIDALGSVAASPSYAQQRPRLVPRYDTDTTRPGYLTSDATRPVYNDDGSIGFGLALGILSTTPSVDASACASSDSSSSSCSSSDSSSSSSD